MTYAEAIQYIEGALKFGINPGLEKIAAICKALGDPQLRYPTIQITGTNGKTSTTWMTRRLLTTMGLKTACYTSPHLHSYRERITIDGEPIAEEAFAGTLEAIMPAVERVRSEYGELTEFEILTAMAFSHFAASGVDVAVFEVGLGGRWDATSMVRPKVAAITSIALDHTDRLGTTVEEIAWDKAHIVKEGSVAVVGAVPHGALEQIEERSRLVGATIKRYGRDFETTRSTIIKNEGSTLSVRGLYGSYSDVRLPLFGGYQVANTTMALTIVEAFTGAAVEPGVIDGALASVSCPGRFELVSREPLVVLDGAHNPDGMRMLASGLPEAFDFADLIVVLAISSDKDIEQMVSTLAQRASLLVLTQNTSYRSASAVHLTDIARGTGKSYIIETDLEQAIDSAIARASADDLVCITGSLYTVADARAVLLGRQPTGASTTRG